MGDQERASAVYAKNITSYIAAQGLDYDAETFDTLRESGYPFSRVLPQLLAKQAEKRRLAAAEAARQEAIKAEQERLAAEENARKAAIKAEQERLAADEAARQAEIKRQQAEAEKIARESQIKTDFLSTLAPEIKSTIDIGNLEIIPYSLTDEKNQPITGNLVTDDPEVKQYYKELQAIPKTGKAVTGYFYGPAPGATPQFQHNHKTVYSDYATQPLFGEIGTAYSEEDYKKITDVTNKLIGELTTDKPTLEKYYLAKSVLEQAKSKGAEYEKSIVIPEDFFRSQKPNVETDYAATLKRAVETGVVLPVSKNLEPTYQKDADKLFNKLLESSPNKIISLDETLGFKADTGKTISLTESLGISDTPQPKPGPVRPSRIDLLKGDQGLAATAIGKQLEYQSMINTKDADFIKPLDITKPVELPQDKQIEQSNNYILSLVEGGKTKEQIKKERLGSLAEVKSFIADVQKSGRTDLLIKTATGTQQVNEATAYRDYLTVLSKDPTAVLELPAMIKLDENLGVSSGQLGPTKISQDKSGKITTIISIQKEPPPQINPYDFAPLSLGKNMDVIGLGKIKKENVLLTLSPAEPAKKQPDQLNDFLDRQTADIEKYVEKSTGIARPGALVIKSAYSLLPSTVGLLKLATSNIENPALPRVPETGTGAILESVLSGRSDKIGEYVSKHGGPVLGGIGLGAEITSDIILGAGKGPLTLAKGVLEVLPKEGLKSATYAVRYTVKGKPFIQEFKTLSQAQKFEAEAVASRLAKDIGISAYTTPIKSLVFGINEKIGAPLISKVGEKTRIGSPLSGLTKDTFTGLSPTGRGLEFGTEGSILQKVFTSKKGQDVLQQAGYLTEQGKQYIPVAQDIAKSIKSIQNELELTTKQNVIDVKIESVLPGKEKETLIEKVLPTLEPIKGGTAQILQVEKPLLEGTGRGIIKDIDVDYNRIAKSLKLIGLGKVSTKLGVDKAIKAVTNAQKEMQAVATGKRTFKVESKTKLVVGEFTGEVEFGARAGPNVLYHGTDVKSAEAILKEGFDLGKSGKQTTNYLKYKIGNINIAEKRAEAIITEGIYATPNPDLATGVFTKTAAKGDILNQALVKITLKPTANILEYSKISKKTIQDFQRLTGSDWRAFNKKLIEYARGKGFEGLSHPISKTGIGNREVILFSKKPIAKLDIIKAEPVLTNKQKVLELLTEEDVIPKASTSPASNLGEVFGTRYTYKSTIGKTPKGKEFKLRSLSDQLLTKVASAASLQGPRSEGMLLTDVDFLKAGAKFETTEKGFYFGTPLFRVKDIVDQPILLKQIAKDVRASGLGETKAVHFEDLAKQVEDIYPQVDFGKGALVGITEGRVPSKPSFFESYGLTPKNLAGFVPTSAASASKTRQPKSPIDRKSITEISSPISVKSKSLESIVNSRIKIGSSIGSRPAKTGIDSIISQINTSKVNKIADLSNVSKATTSRPSGVKVSSIISSSKTSVLDSLVKPSKISSVSSSILKSKISPISSLSKISSISPISGVTPSGVSPISGVTPSGVSPISGVTPSGVFPSGGKSTIPKIKITITGGPPGGGKTKILIPPIKFPKRRFPRQSYYTKSVRFYTNPSDPLRAGVIAAQGVREYQSADPSIFKTLDIALAKSRKRNKWAGLDQPYAGFKIKKLKNLNLKLKF